MEKQKFNFQIVTETEGINTAFFGETDCSLQELLDHVNWFMTHGSKDSYKIVNVNYQPKSPEKNESQK